VIHLVVLACVLRATTKKGRQLFWRKKCNPRENPTYGYKSEKKSSGCPWIWYVVSWVNLTQSKAVALCQIDSRHYNKFYWNRPSFIEDVTKTFWLSFLGQGDTKCSQNRTVCGWVIVVFNVTAILNLTESGFWPFRGHMNQFSIHPLNFVYLRYTPGKRNRPTCNWYSFVEVGQRSTKSKSTKLNTVNTI